MLTNEELHRFVVKAICLVVLLTAIAAAFFGSGLTWLLMRMAQESK